MREELGESHSRSTSRSAPPRRGPWSTCSPRSTPSRCATPKASLNIGAWLTNFVAGFSPRTLAYGATAAALAIVLQAGVIAGVFLKDQPGGAQLASHGQVITDNGSFVLVRFNADATAGDITKFLQDNKAVVVGGPAAGMFKLRVADTALPQGEVKAIADRMAQDRKLVGFAAPSQN